MHGEERKKRNRKEKEENAETRPHIKIQVTQAQSRLQLEKNTTKTRHVFDISRAHKRKRITSNGRKEHQIAESNVF